MKLSTKTQTPKIDSCILTLTFSSVASSEVKILETNSETETLERKHFMIKKDSVKQLNAIQIGQFVCRLARNAAMPVRDAQQSYRLSTSRAVRIECRSTRHRIQSTNTFNISAFVSFNGLSINST